ncbi:myelin-oligodendrocyte glycoprotein-like isoform X1 [Malaclemys terrapin pileata]|uniref:myelin-oligodendrocyte glycoprotein-like isoform X1 n=1 Tax=Malaclemys terrapin pileata TaxID=2991368 RepID=UPI0023A88926|nr:myelin-oligodendrocyte glycoprotein-like isoform X1 [Malaclemys terrapin pileata]
MKMRISFHSHCAMGNPSLSSYPLFFFTVHVSTLESVNFKVIGPDHPIMASAGEDALLPCHLFRNTSAQKMEVRWYRSKFSEPIHLYQNEKDQAEQQIPNYQGRTELLKDGIVNGSVVLRIRNITPSDHGQFICFFRSSRFYAEATLELKVTECISPSYTTGGQRDLTALLHLRIYST